MRVASQAVPPIARTACAVGDGNDFNLFRLVTIDDGIRKFADVFRHLFKRRTHGKILRLKPGFAKRNLHAPARGKARCGLDETIFNQPVRAGEPSKFHPYFARSLAKTFSAGSRLVNSSGDQLKSTHRLSQLRGTFMETKLSQSRLRNFNKAVFQTCCFRDPFRQDLLCNDLLADVLANAH